MVDCEGRRMEPVRERQNSKIDFVIACRRAMYDNRATKTVSVLN